jgi:hypothetical protein
MKYDSMPSTNEKLLAQVTLGAAKRAECGRKAIIKNTLGIFSVGEVDKDVAAPNQVPCETEGSREEQ